VRRKLPAHGASTGAHYLSGLGEPLIMPQDDEGLRPLRRFRTAAVRLSLLVTIVMAAMAYVFVDAAAAQGVLLGGLAGILGFWIIAVRLEKLANIAPGKVRYAALTWTSLRFLLYGAALTRAYMIDREELHGLLGAVAGILVIHFVMIFMGLTGLEIPRTTGENTADSANNTSESDTQHTDEQ